MTKEQEAQQAQAIEDHAEFVAKFKEFASEPQNELSKQSEEVLQSKLNQAEKSLIDLQAQEIARIKAQKYFQTTQDNAIDLLVRDKDLLLEIVDSRAQKIAELSALFQKAGNGAVDLAMKCAEQEVKIAEQGKQIERLSKRGVKKYSEEELQEGFEASCVSNKDFLIKADIGNYALSHIQNRWLGFLGGARFLGALEEI